MLFFLALRLPVFLQPGTFLPLAVTLKLLPQVALTRHWQVSSALRSSDPGDQLLWHITSSRLPRAVLFILKMAPLIENQKSTKQPIALARLGIKEPSLCRIILNSLCGCFPLSSAFSLAPFLFFCPFAVTGIIRWSGFSFWCAPYLEVKYSLWKHGRFPSSLCFISSHLRFSP